MDDRLVRAAGTARERGESIGAAAGERIRALLTAQDREHRDRDGLSLHGWLPAARRYEPLVREHAPVTAAEMAGMAAGAGLLEDELPAPGLRLREVHGGRAPAPARAPARASGAGDGRSLHGARRGGRCDGRRRRHLRPETTTSSVADWLRGARPTSSSTTPPAMGCRP